MKVLLNDSLFPQIPLRLFSDKVQLTTRRCDSEFRAELHFVGRHCYLNLLGFYNLELSRLDIGVLVGRLHRLPRPIFAEDSEREISISISAVSVHFYISQIHLSRFSSARSLAASLS